MTEENKDSPPPKLRLSRKPKEAETGDQAKAEETPEPKPEETPEPKPDLTIKRPTPPAGMPDEINEPPAEATVDRPFDPENPFAGIDIKKPKEKRQPPELPSKPAPVENDGSARKAEEAIDRIGGEKKNHGVMTSVLVLIILLVVLGGSGYGLYYILRSPAENTGGENAEARTGVQPGAATEEAAQDADGLLSGPINKAKAVVSKKEESETNWENEKPSAPVEKPTTGPPPETGDEAEPAKKAEPTTEAKAEATTPSTDSSQTNLVSEFLQSAHIGGVRTGDRPKLILNGQSYNQGDLVDADTGLRFIGFRDKKLAFRDAQGVVYIKTF